MNYNAFLIKYAEIGIKGKNRYMFEDALMKQIKNTLYRQVSYRGFVVEKEQGRIFVKVKENGEPFMPEDYDEVVEALQHVFGITAICPVVVDSDYRWEHLKDAVCEYVNEAYPDKRFTFKVMVRRANKQYPKNSCELAADLGEQLLLRFPELKVDVHKPEVYVNVELRNQLYIYSKEIKGVGGMPLGTNGKGMLLLSGGIDSPVAGYMIAKRGVYIDAVYFHAPPYTSERAKEKVVDLAKKISKYCGTIHLHVVNFTDIQMAIYEKCPHDELTIIMRRYMMRIAEHFARKADAQALITGESIGQVASQTIYSLVSTNAVCELPVFRPLIGFDKQEIVDISEQIDTYETSILPYEDCCTTFVAKHPVTKPKLSVIEKSEEHLSDVIQDLMEQAISTVELITIQA